MELVQAGIFIPLLILAVTQMIKMLLPTVQGWVTIIVALLIGVVVGIVDIYVGVQDISIAQGVVFALEAVGLSVVASKAGGGARGDA